MKSILFRYRRLNSVTRVTRTLVIRVLILLALGAAIYEEHRPLRLVAFIVLIAYIVQWVTFRDRREAITIVRRRRHRLANQLQLVSGWLQLGQVAKAEEALAALMASEGAQSLWFRGMPTRWCYLFMMWDARFEAIGIYLEWTGVQTLMPSYVMAWMLERRLRQAIRRPGVKQVSVEIEGKHFQVRASGDMDSFPRGWQETPQGWMVRWPTPGGHGRML